MAGLKRRSRNTPMRWKFMHPLFAQFGDALVDQGRIGAGRGKAIAGAAGDFLDIAGDAR